MIYALTPGMAVMSLEQLGLLRAGILFNPCYAPKYVIPAASSRNPAVGTHTCSKNDLFKIPPQNSS